MRTTRPRIGHLSFTSYRKNLESPVIHIGQQYRIEGHQTLKGICKVVSLDMHLTQTDSGNNVMTTRCWPGVDLGHQIEGSHTLNGKLSKPTGKFISCDYLKPIT